MSATCSYTASACDSLKATHMSATCSYTASACCSLGQHSCLLHVVTQWQQKFKGYRYGFQCCYIFRFHFLVCLFVSALSTAGHHMLWNYSTSLLFLTCAKEDIEIRYQFIRGKPAISGGKNNCLQICTKTVNYIFNSPLTCYKLWTSNLNGWYWCCFMHLSGMAALRNFSLYNVENEPKIDN